MNAAERRRWPLEAREGKDGGCWSYLRGEQPGEGLNLNPNSRYHSNQSGRLVSWIRTSSGWRGLEGWEWRPPYTVPRGARVWLTRHSLTTSQGRDATRWIMTPDFKIDSRRAHTDPSVLSKSPFPLSVIVFNPRAQPKSDRRSNSNLRTMFRVAVLLSP